MSMDMNGRWHNLAYLKRGRGHMTERDISKDLAKTLNCSTNNTFSYGGLYRPKSNIINTIPIAQKDKEFNTMLRITRSILDTENETQNHKEVISDFRKTFSHCYSRQVQRNKQLLKGNKVLSMYSGNFDLLRKTANISSCSERKGKFTHDLFGFRKVNNTTRKNLENAIKITRSIIPERILKGHSKQASRIHTAITKSEDFWRVGGKTERLWGESRNTDNLYYVENSIKGLGNSKSNINLTPNIKHTGIKTIEVTGIKRKKRELLNSSKTPLNISPQNKPIESRIEEYDRLYTSLIKGNKRIEESKTYLNKQKYMVENPQVSQINVPTKNSLDLTPKTPPETHKRKEEEIGSNLEREKWREEEISPSLDGFCSQLKHISRLSHLSKEDSTTPKPTNPPQQSISKSIQADEISNGLNIVKLGIGEIGISTTVRPISTGKGGASLAPTTNILTQDRKNSSGRISKICHAGGNSALYINKPIKEVHLQPNAHKIIFSKLKTADRLLYRDHSQTWKVSDLTGLGKKEESENVIREEKVIREKNTVVRAANTVKVNCDLIGVEDINDLNHTGTILQKARIPLISVQFKPQIAKSKIRSKY